MKNKSVGRVILNTIKEKWLLTAGIVITDYYVFRISSYNMSYGERKRDFSYSIRTKDYTLIKKCVDV